MDFDVDRIDLESASKGVIVNVKSLTCKTRVRLRGNRQTFVVGLFDHVCDYRSSALS